MQTPIMSRRGLHYKEVFTDLVSDACCSPAICYIAVLSISAVLPICLSDAKTWQLYFLHF